MAANDPTIMVISGQRGMYEPHEYGSGFLDKPGTMMRNRSSHIPTTTPHEAITQPVIVRSFRIARNGNGRMKLQNTIVQKSGAKVPICVDQNTAISDGSFPYHVVSRSLKTKYPHNRLMV